MNWGIRAAHTLAQPELKRLQDIGADADGDLLGGFPHRIAREMCVARGRLHPAVTEQPADDRQALAERERPRGEGMSDVMDAHVAEPGLRADTFPRPVDVRHVPARLGARNDPGTGGLARQVREDADRRRRQVNRAGASFPIGEVNFCRVEIDMLPAQGQDFVSAAARQHQQADRRDRAGGYRGTPDTPLADVRMSAGSQIDPEVVYEFCPPREVPWRMTELRVNTYSLLNEPNQDDYDKLIALAYTFSRFGKIHPFLDGNGHVQRAVLAVMATEFGFPLSPRFVIHPRPFDRLLAVALENFGRAPADEEQEELGLVAEYLAFFLEGPFNAPRKHVGIASLHSS